jgi:hypothetical protein
LEVAVAVVLTVVMVVVVVVLVSGGGDVGGYACSESWFTDVIEERHRQEDGGHLRDASNK